MKTLYVLSRHLQKTLLLSLVTLCLLCIPGRQNSPNPLRCPVCMDCQQAGSTLRQEFKGFLDFDLTFPAVPLLLSLVTLCLLCIPGRQNSPNPLRCPVCMDCQQAGSTLRQEFKGFLDFDLTFPAVPQYVYEVTFTPDTIHVPSKKLLRPFDLGKPQERVGERSMPESRSLGRNGEFSQSRQLILHTDPFLQLLQSREYNRT